MKYVADLHVHSHYSIATSKKSNLEGFYQWAKIKGIDLIGTGDFTHPGWFRELNDKLVPEEHGFFRLKDEPKGQAIEGLSCRDIDIRFCLSSEISSIYKKNDRVRKVHSLVFAPNLETASKISAKLSTIGNIKSDGRPILGLDPKQLLEIILEISPEAYLIPAHIWTPWFSLFGSKSGFDAIEDCFEELTEYIFALETGLSSDPAMNWTWSALDRYSLVSHSDAHSPAKLGREADLFDAEFSYGGMFDALKTKKGRLGTIEFYPEEGKYHLDGHRKCGVCIDPEETKRLKGKCPVCGKNLTIGVLHRVLDLSDRSESSKPAQAGDFRYVVPLHEILAEIMNTGPSTKAVASRYREIVGRFGNEFTFLLESPLEEIQNETDGLTEEAVRRMRNGKVNPQPGYDGQFGIIRVFNQGELEKLRGQGTLFDTIPIKRSATSDRAAAQKLDGHAEPVPRDKLPPEFIPKELFADTEQLNTEQLNTEQQKVLSVYRGAVLITAGPGTGKTRTLTSWIVSLIEAYGASTSSILAITFTNKAARELASRLDSMLGSQARPRAELEVTVCTFHALCFDLLRQRHPHLIAVYDESAREALLRLLRPDVSGQMIKKHSALLQRLMEGTAEPDRSADREVLRLLSQYREKLDAIGSVDVSDVITKLNSLFAAEPAFLKGIQNRFRFIAVDEFQDINANQYLLLANLMGDGSDDKGFLVIGDPDQAIYGFRGSDLRLFFRFREDYKPQEIVLSANYRSIPGIVEAAKGLIAHNTLKSKAPLKALRSGASRIQLSRLDRPFDEALFVAHAIEEHLGGMSHISIDELESRDEGSYSFSDFAVLARTRAVRDEMIPVLSARGIPLSLGENRSLASEPPLSDALPVLKVIVNPRDLSGISEILTHVLPGIGLSIIRDELLRWSEAGFALSDLLESLHQARAIPLESLRAFEEFIDFFEDIKSHSGERGLADTLHRIWKWFSKEKMDTDTLLRREALLQMAKEYEFNIGGFLRRIALSPFESEGPLKIERVSLLTFHAAKGLEFPVVFVVGAEEGICPITSATRGGNDTPDTEDPLEEERRLFYVALTRAKDRLCITSCARRKVFGTWKEMDPSRFLQELPKESTETLTVKRKLSRGNEQQLPLF